MKIAMWSGPRNLSTAMMYSFAARGDCAAWDEPFYAAYLQATALDHPMREDIIAAGEIDPIKVAATLRGPSPGAKAVFYQKHMTHHMIDAFDRGWFKDVTHVFLIRDPARVIASYNAKRERPTLDDIGFRQQAEIFDQICQMNGAPPPVIDSYDIRKNPEFALRALCEKIGLTFTMQMLNWPKGGHPSDGVWAAHWYAAVRQSGGFAGAEGPAPVIEGPLKDVENAARDYYDHLSKYAISAAAPALPEGAAAGR